MYFQELKPLAGVFRGTRAPENEVSGTEVSGNEVSGTAAP